MKASKLAELALTMALLLLVGCNGPVQGVSRTSPPPYGVFSGTLQLAGEVAVKGSFTDAITSRRETCDQYVHGLAPATTLWVVPTPNNGSSIAGHAVTFTAGVPANAPSSGYHGPGTYAEPSAVVADLIVDESSFLPGSAAKTTISIAADGSGSLSFTDMVDTSTSAIESGTEHWKCSG
jgi:hypothetical protein